MKVVITGATGFIGRALCNELLNHEHQVSAIVRKNLNKTQYLPPDVKILHADIEELDQLTGEFDVFYHLAWNGSVGNDRNDFSLQSINLDYLRIAMLAAYKFGCSKFIGAGSQAEYGLVKERTKEDTTPNPFMMYGAAKLACYYMGNILAEQLKISFVWPRIYSVYGVGENEGTLISYLVNSLNKDEIPQVSHCQNMWDFMYISDCVKALRMLGEIRETEGIYNVSAGNPRILKEYVEDIRRIVQPKCKIEFGSKTVDSGKICWLNPDITKLKKIGFSCEVGFEEGIRKKLSEKRESENCRKGIGN